jgi:hypothetical protein
VNQSKFQGDGHVSSIYEALTLKHTTGYWPASAPNGILETALYIWDKFQGITNVQCKFDFERPDQHHDLTIYVGKVRFAVNLFQIHGSGKIQPKNLGARSFLSKYFLAAEIQEDFNHFLDQSYHSYIISLLEAKGVSIQSSSTTELKKQVSLLCPHFDETSNLSRDTFLYSLREYCFSLLIKTYNTYQEGFRNAFNTLLMAEETTIITRFHKNKVTIEQLNIELPPYQEMKLYKKGRNSIGVQMGTVSLLLRFKFENKPDSSIKLATSYEFFDQVEDFTSKNRKQNENTLMRVHHIEASTQSEHKDNISNAVGKCHEAYVYYWLLTKYPDCIQTDDDDCLTFLAGNLPFLAKDLADRVKESSSLTATAIAEYIENKYDAKGIESLQLVADIYVEDKMNTGDVKVNLRTSTGSIEELYISLKAIKSGSQKITTKNPGIGTILGSSYFDIRDLSETILRVKEQFELDQDHHASLASLSREIGDSLQHAPQENLRKGLENLLGKALTVITAYEQKQVHCLEHHQIEGPVHVLAGFPTEIQNTLVWNEGKESLSLRVKFSRAQKYGWSTVKLASEYEIN